MRAFFRQSWDKLPQLKNTWWRWLVLVGLASTLPFIVALAYNWPQLDGNSGYPGWNTQETILSIQNVANLTHNPSPAYQFQSSLPSVADGAAAYLSNVNTGASTQDLLFVTTKAGHIIALDAHTGATVWSHQNGPGSCKINNGSTTCYTTSSPAIDPNKQYVYSYGLDGKAHKYQIGNGTEITTGGWPETTTLKAFDEKGSSALSIATDSQIGTSYLYVANGGYPGDNGDYQGHITVINLTSGAQTVFNTLCSDQTVHFVEQPGTPDCGQAQSAVWARPGVVYDPLNNKIYIATGNGTFDPVNNYWGDSVLKLNPDGTGAAGGKPLDSYTPGNFSQLQNSDADLGSTVVALLPQVSGAVPNLAVQSGKDSVVRLLNLDNLSNQSGTPGPGHTGGELFSMNLPQGGGVLTMPATWLNPLDKSSWTFITNGNGTSALKLSYSGSVPKLTKVWQNSVGGTSPIIADNILFYIGGGNLYAFDPRTGASLWTGTLGGGTHWESAMVANGWVYGTDEGGHITGFALSQALSPETIGVYRNGVFYLHSSNTTGNAELTIPFGAAGDRPVVGDWTGSGLDTIGVFNPNNGLFSLRNTNTAGTPDEQFVLGVSNDVPLAGRWTVGATHFGAGVFRPSNGLIYLKNSLTTGFADITMVLGIPGDDGVAGDWNGDEVDSPGVYRPSTQHFYLSNQVCNCSVFGDYGFQYGVSGDLPVMGDWIGQGHDGVGLFRQSNGLTYLRNSLSTGNADNSFVYGIAGDIPVAGRWSGIGGPVPNPTSIPATQPSVITPPTSQPTNGGPGD